MTAISYDEDVRRVQEQVIIDALREARLAGERQVIVDRVYRVPAEAVEARYAAIMRRVR